SLLETTERFDPLPPAGVPIIEVEGHAAVLGAEQVKSKAPPCSPRQVASDHGPESRAGSAFDAQKLRKMFAIRAQETDGGKVGLPLVTEGILQSEGEAVTGEGEPAKPQRKRLDGEVPQAVMSAFV